MLVKNKFSTIAVKLAREVYLATRYQRSVHQEGMDTSLHFPALPRTSPHLPAPPRISQPRAERFEKYPIRLVPKVLGRPQRIRAKVGNGPRSNLSDKQETEAEVENDIIA